jgi:alpha-ketoglutarate-dependent taurine dioxygenase
VPCCAMQHERAVTLIDAYMEQVILTLAPANLRLRNGPLSCAVGRLRLPGSNTGNRGEHPMSSAALRRDNAEAFESESKAAQVPRPSSGSLQRGLAERIDSAPWSPAQGVASLRKQFEQHGFVLFRGIGSAATFLELFSRLGRIYRHHDSLENGLTHVRSVAMAQTDAADANRRGLTQDGLTPHTDRSGIDHPPKLLAFWIERQSAVGGASLFVDGHQLFDEVSAKSPAAIEALTRPKSVVFKSEKGLLESSIFDLREEELRIRFRFDRLVYMSPDVAAVVEDFMGLARDIALKLRLQSDEGYLIDNHRWLHGRTHFTGERSAYRLLLSEGTPDAA